MIMMSREREKVAIVHNWYWNYRGAERVLTALTEIYPDADLFFLFGDEKKIIAKYPGHKIRFSFLQNIPLIRSIYKLTLPLWPIATEALDLSEYSSVISSSASTVWGVITHPNATHIAYVYSPMRYLWDQKDIYLRNMSRPIRILFRTFAHYLRMWDLVASSRPDSIIVISEYVKERLQKYYNRTADRVIYPPLIDLDELFNYPDKKKKEHLVVVSGFEENKGAIEAIEYAIRSNEVVYLTGEHSIIRKLNKRYSKYKNVHFTGWLDRQDLLELIAEAKATLFFGEEDLGLVPLESIALGTPVVALASGGALETIEDGVNGVFIDELEYNAIHLALKRCEGIRINRRIERERYEKFSNSNFRTAITKVVKDAKAQRQ